MSSNKIAGLGLMISRHNLLCATRPALFAQGLVPNHYASFSDSESRIQDMGDALRERSEQTNGTMMDAIRDTSGKGKNRAIGTTGAKSGQPSKDPELNHGVEKTDSSCEDVRDRPGGYS